MTYDGLRTPDGIRDGLGAWWGADAIEASIQAGQELVATVEDVVIGVARHDRLAAEYAPRPDWAGAPVLWCLCGNEPASTFYQRQGFQPVIACPPEPDEPAYHWFALPGAGENRAQGVGRLA